MRSRTIGPRAMTPPCVSVGLAASWFRTPRRRRRGNDGSGRELGDLFDVSRRQKGLEGLVRVVPKGPFSFGVPQSSSFRLDWRRDYIPLDAGFSLNVHGHIEPIGYPIVELLAAIELSHARPTAGRDKSGRRNKLEYRYGVVGRDATCRDLWLSPMFLRAGLGGLKDLPFPMRRFRMKLDWPGQENQARAITVVTEET